MFCVLGEYNRSPPIIKANFDIPYDLLIPNRIIANQIISIIGMHSVACKMRSDCPCESRIDQMVDSLFLRTLFGCISIADEAEKKVIYLLSSITSDRRRRNSTDIFCFGFLKNVNNRIRGGVMRFISLCQDRSTHFFRHILGGNVLHHMSSGWVTYEIVFVSALQRPK